ncbi:MAG: protein kinase [Labilithrix sp.]|nr:protein kinase [Labilithrix sp.]
MPALVREGEVFAGKYRIERVLGEGGHGLVFAARSLELDELVAVKLLKRISTDATTAERFLREARAALRIRGDGVARVYAVDRLDDGDLFMVMEYLEGHDLRREVQEMGPLAVGDAVECILQVCDVLGRAHGMGIIHRDIKSANLFSVKRPDGLRHIKVLDFGIARSLDPVEASLTQAAQMMGSPHYMAPEQVVDGRTVDERTDIWGLGATLFELLAGVTPFGGGTMLQLLLRLQTQPPDDLRLLRPEVPAELERVVLRCLEKDRAHRFPDVGSLSTALAPFARIGVELTASSMRSDARDSADLDLTATNALEKGPAPVGAAPSSTVRSAGASAAGAAPTEGVATPSSTVRSAEGAAAAAAPAPTAEGAAGPAPTAARPAETATSGAPASTVSTARAILPERARWRAPWDSTRVASPPAAPPITPVAATVGARRSAPATSRATAPLLLAALVALLGVVAVMKLRGPSARASASEGAPPASVGTAPIVATTAEPVAVPPAATPAVGAPLVGTSSPETEPSPATASSPGTEPATAQAGPTATARKTPRPPQSGRPTAVGARPPSASTPLPDDRQ